MNYESLVTLIEPYADGPFDDLPADLRERVNEDFPLHWETLTPNQRRSLALQSDVQNDPAYVDSQDAKAGLHKGYYGVNHIQLWLTMGAASPQEAALLFFGKNPSDYTDNLPDLGDAFRSMKRAFEDAARDGQARNLRDWLSVAHARNLDGVAIDGWEACIALSAQDTTEQCDTVPPAASVVTETPEQRRAKWLEWREQEEKSSTRGALERVWKREKLTNPKADRSYIGKQIKVAKEERDRKKRAGAIVPQVVKNGKRQG